ncbi:MAG: indole-3-glycerol phosphate synthase TrpC [Myxococcales bacterium]|nr:indole-3-glycerol phosphate synthase TrpC [Myxococcales bacterium]
MSILQRIIAHKQHELAEAQAEVPWPEIVALAEAAPPARDFCAALRRRDGAIAIIAEVKRASPSAGWIAQDADPKWVATRYAAAGADAISVLTDETFFGGHPSFLPAIAEVAAIPLLRKDFIIDEYQVYQARALGADAVLLIIAGLAADQFAALAKLIAALGMTALVEVHDGDELDVAVNGGANLIGINHRNLSTMQVDMSLGERLLRRLPKEVTAIAESGIATHADLLRMQALGFHAALVGESLMRKVDPGAALHALRTGELA